MLYQHIVDNCFQLINIKINGVWRKKIMWDLWDLWEI